MLIGGEREAIDLLGVSVESEVALGVADIPQVDVVERACRYYVLAEW